MKKIISNALIAMIFAGAASPSYAQKTDIGINEGVNSSGKKITIITAYSCIYCRVFDMKSNPDIRQKWMKRGYQIQTVPVSISPTDLPASIAAKCGNVSGFGRRTTMLFRAQPEIASNWRSADEKAKQRAIAAPKTTSTYQIAKLSGITDLAPTLGITPEKLSQCLKDKTMITKQINDEALADKKWSIKGTPTIFVNGKTAGSTWESVQKALSKR